MAAQTETGFKYNPSIIERTGSEKILSSADPFISNILSLPDTLYQLVTQVGKNLEKIN